MKPGDFLQVLGEDGESWYAEVVTVKPLEVYFIEKTADRFIWKYSEEWYEIPPESIEIHISTKGVVDALAQLGFRALSESTFIRIEDEDHPELTSAVPLDDIPEDDPIGIHPEMQDFIVPDEEGERFTHAVPDNDFVRETHEAVHAYNDWQPADGEQKRVHAFIEQLDQRTCQDEMARGLESIPYTRPPVDYKPSAAT